MQNLSQGKLDEGTVTLFPPLDDDHEGLPAHLAEQFHRMKRRSYKDEEMRELALETAVLVHNEIQHMQNSIAELENMLRQPAERGDGALNGFDDSVSRTGNNESEILIAKPEISLKSAPSSEGSTASD
ncbi:hypothetical protein FisN_22Hh140 [Fistulifera solaris]|jgi:hypothetical protein|uniref:Uncharacterized protein n=1 Tax=Fistulifera solaris TaxID=1519565 RepID=A0A1Z5JPN4_FISSO|nr:hypothetical protein FisN_22Hh140 [Fistulifera solaris]|eukprot:GAX16003.1 hypothetical protein FisN_22Hh140 [Fistulifera solaris]